MAKRRKSSKRKSSKCLEPFNSLIDLAAGATMNVIADIMEKKHRYRKRGDPNPYRATAFGLSTGRLNSTEDLIRFGAFLGAMGSFDDDPADMPRQRTYDIPWQFDDLSYGMIKPHSNKYAWRMNCEDGSSYGVDPQNYETKDAYISALASAKSQSVESCLPMVQVDVDSFEETEFKQDTASLLFCKVSLLDSGKNDYFIADGVSPIVGDTVLVPDGAGNEQRGIVLTVEQRQSELTPQEIADTPHILGIL